MKRIKYKIKEKKYIALLLGILLCLSLTACYMYILNNRYLDTPDASDSTDTEDVWNNETPIINSIDVGISCCNTCGCNLIDNRMKNYYNDYNIYILDSRDKIIAENIRSDNNGKYSTGASYPHPDPKTGEIVQNHSGASNYQRITGLPNHTIPEIAKILPKLQITCTEDNWNMSIQGDVLCLKYTGEEQHPFSRVVNDEGVISEDNYSVFYRYIGEDFYSGNYNLSTDCPYDLSDSLKNWLYDSSEVPVSNQCIEEGRYAAVIRFNETSEYRGNLWAYFIIKKDEPDPTPEPTPAPTTTPTVTPTTSPTVSPTIDPTKDPSTTPSPTPTVETKTATDTEVTTKSKVTVGDTFKSKTAQYTIISESTLSYDKPLKSSKTVKVPDTIKVNKKTYKVTDIRYKAFYGDKKLTKLTIGKNVEVIGKNAFRGCTKLNSVKFKGNKLTKIDAGAFRGCTKLKTIKLPSTKLKTIGNSAFYGCKNLKNITLKSKKISFGKKCFNGISKKAVFKVPKSKVKLYKKKIIKNGKAPDKIKVKKY